MIYITVQVGKKLIVALMGVLMLQSCTAYRIKVITDNDVKYFVPEKRNVLGGWNEMDYYTSDLTYKGAKAIIDEDKHKVTNKKSYIKIK